jgi:hypothetical protein
MSYSKVIELENTVRNLRFHTSKTEMYDLALEGKLDDSVPFAEFVGTEATIKSEKARRSQLAKDRHNIEYEAWKVAELDPLYKEINDLTMELIPTSLLPAKDVIYSMAYERGHSAGYSEVYNVLSGMIDDLENIVKLCKGLK